MDNIVFIFGLILAVPLWFLYHKIFTVFYIDAFWGIIGEIIGAIFTGCLLANLLVSFLGNILGSLLNALGGILKIAIPIILILVVIGAISALIKRKILETRGSVIQRMTLPLR